MIVDVEAARAVPRAEVGPIKTTLGRVKAEFGLHPEHLIAETALWGVDAAPGQSKFEVGRSIIRSNSEHPAWFGNWRVAELNGVLAGAVNSYVLPAPSRTAPPAPEVKGLNDLKTVATGTWYIASAALHPEHQGKGFGEFLLAEAETLARTAKTSQLTLMVGSFNERARRLYLRFGFAERAKRPFTAFPGSDAPGEWILMGKDLA